MLQKRQKKGPAFGAMTKEEIDKVDPQDFYTTGAPQYTKALIPAAMGIGFVVGIEILKRGIVSIDAATLNQLSDMQGPVGLAVMVAFAIIGALLHTSTFSREWMQIEPAVMRNPVTNTEICTAMRLAAEPTVLWWPGRVFKTETPPADPPATAITADASHSSPAQPDTSHIPVPVRPTITIPEGLLDPRSGVYKVVNLVNVMNAVQTIPRTARTREVDTLKERFESECQKVTLPFYVELFSLRGNRQCIVIAPNPITGQETVKTGGAIELQRHCRVQRTYTWQAENPGATWGTFSRLGVYVSYTIPPRWRRLLPRWDVQLNVFPIYFITGSAGLSQEIESSFTRTRDAIKAPELAQVREAYEISIVPEIIDDLRIATNALDRRDKAEEQEHEEKDTDNKREAAGFFSMYSRAPGQGRTGLGAKAKAWLSKGAMKIVMYIAIILVAAYLLNVLFSMWGA
jgi:hypothetical protein